MNNAPCQNIVQFNRFWWADMLFSNAHYQFNFIIDFQKEKEPAGSLQQTHTIPIHLIFVIVPQLLIPHCSVAVSDPSRGRFRNFNGHNSLPESLLPFS